MNKVASGVETSRNLLDASAQLIPSEIQTFSKEHPRCGAGFLLTVVVISILFFILLGDLALGVRLASRIVLIPALAAASYELIRFSSKHLNIFVFDWLIVRPSLALQVLTTRQPTDDMPSRGRGFSGCKE